MIMCKCVLGKASFKSFLHIGWCFTIQEIVTCLKWGFIWNHVDSWLLDYSDLYASYRVCKIVVACLIFEYIKSHWCYPRCSSDLKQWGMQKTCSHSCVIMDLGWSRYVSFSNSYPKNLETIVDHEYINEREWLWIFLIFNSTTEHW